MITDKQFFVSEVIHARVGNQLKLMIAGQPCALQRPRFKWHVSRQQGGGRVHGKYLNPKITVWNPSEKDQTSMRQCIERMIQPLLDEKGCSFFFPNKTKCAEALSYHATHLHTRH